MKRLNEMKWTPEHLRELRAALGLPDITRELEQIERERQALKEYIPNSPELASSLFDDPYRYFDGAKFKEDDRCKRCGCALNDEAADVDGERWCHPCADEKEP